MSVWTNSLLAMTHFRLGQPEPARTALEAAAKGLGGPLELPRKNLTSALPTAWWLEVQENLFFREATLLIDGNEPRDDPRQWYARGQALEMLGHSKEAIAAYTLAVGIDPKYSAALERRSELYFGLGDWANMFKDLEQRRALEPNNAQVANDLSWCLATCPIPSYRNPKRAIELAELAVKLAPSGANCWNTLGVVRYRAGDWNGAAQATLKSMELSGGASFWDWYTLACCEWRLDQRERARQLLIQAYRRTPPEATQDPFYLELRDEAAALIGERASTGGNSPNDPSAYTLLLEIEPEAVWIYALRARVCVRLKQWDQVAADTRACDASQAERLSFLVRSSRRKARCGGSRGLSQSSAGNHRQLS